MLETRGSTLLLGNTHAPTLLRNAIGAFNVENAKPEEAALD